MKNWIFFLFAMVATSSIGFAFQNSVTELVDPVVFSITKPLSGDSITRQIIDQASLSMADLYRQEQPNNKEVILNKAGELIKSFSEFIRANPKNEASLTLTFYIGLALVFSQEVLRFQSDEWQATGSQAVRTFNFLSDSFPTSWEAKFGSLFTPEYLASRDERDCQAQVGILKRSIPIVRDLDMDQKFRTFLEVVYGDKGPFEASCRDHIIYLELRLGQIQDAEKDFAELVSLGIASDRTLKYRSGEIVRAKDRAKNK